MLLIEDETRDKPARSSGTNGYHIYMGYEVFIVHIIAMYSMERPWTPFCAPLDKRGLQGLDMDAVIFWTSLAE